MREQNQRDIKHALLIALLGESSNTKSGVCVSAFIWHLAGAFLAKSTLPISLGGKQ